jgi:hypothetical protein
MSADNIFKGKGWTVRTAYHALLEEVYQMSNDDKSNSAVLGAPRYINSSKGMEIRNPNIEIRKNDQIFKIEAPCSKLQGIFEM